MVKLKKKDDPVANIVQSISYGTGLICAKVTNLSKVATKTKEWKGVMTKTQDMVKNAEKTVKEKITDMKESFDEGVESIVQEEHKFMTRKSTAKKKAEDTAEEAEIVVPEKVAIPKKRRTAVSKKEVEDKEEEIVVPEQENVTQEESATVQQEDVVVPQEQKAEIAPLPNELEPEGTHEHIDEELMDEEETPKVKAPSSKAKKKAIEKSLESPMLFTIEEFKKEGKDPQELIDAIHKNKPEIYIEAPGPVEWLNELLSNGVSGKPLQYSIEETPEVKEAREAFESASEQDKTQAMIKLNRLTLELAYPLKCPKIQVEQTIQDTQEIKDGQSSEENIDQSSTGMNLN